MKQSIFFIVLLAFVLRMGLGITGAILLPQVGYDSKPQQAGYLLLDAYKRDAQAWELAQSGKPLSNAFNSKYASDQYGGLLWVSAFAYRYIPADGHQPLLIVFLAALIGALGSWFVYQTGKRLLDAKSAMLAALVFALFPEAILQGAAQMREPFLMTFVVMAFYGMVEWNAPAPRARAAWLWTMLGLAGMYFISPGIVLVALVGTAGWMYFGGVVRKIPWQAAAIAAGIFIIALLALATSWETLVAVKGGGVLGILGNWARGTAKWNSYLLGRSSGIVQLLFEALPGSLAMPFVAGYGILQPVLPAAILEPSIPFWQVLGIIRSLGWYLLLPWTAFAPFAAEALPGGARRRQWLWLNLIVWGWIVIAALRGGGDQWDNPRYRVILLGWMALVAGLAFEGLKTGAGRWFWRIAAVEVIILLVFGHWYMWRYLGFGFNIGIRNTLGLAMGLSMLVVLGDWLRQRRQANSKKSPPPRV